MSSYVMTLRSTGWAPDRDVYHDAPVGHWSTEDVVNLFVHSRATRGRHRAATDYDRMDGESEVPRNRLANLRHSSPSPKRKAEPARHRNSPTVSIQSSSLLSRVSFSTGIRTLSDSDSDNEYRGRRQKNHHRKRHRESSSSRGSGSSRAAVQCIKQWKIAFAGRNDEKPDEFLKDLAESRKTMGFSSTKALQALPRILEGHANQWYRSEKEKFKDTRENFGKAFCRQFVCSNDDEENMDYLRAHVEVAGEKIIRVPDYCQEISHTSV